MPADTWSTALALNVAIYTVAYVLVWFFKAQVAQQMGMAIIFTYFWHLAAYSMLVMLNVLLENYCAAFQKIRAASFLTIQREIIATLATLYAAFRYRGLEEIFLALIIARAVTMASRLRLRAVPTPGLPFPALLPRDAGSRSATVLCWGLAGPSARSPCACTRSR